MSKNRNSRNASYWRDAFSRFEKSNLSIRKFCSNEGVSENSFFSWRRKLAEPDGKSFARNNSARLTQGNHQDPCSPFIPVQISDGTLEVTHPRGYQLRIPENFSPTALRQVLAVLDQQED